MNPQTSLVLLAVKERTPPKEAKLFHFGTNETLKGDFILTRTGAAELMAKYDAWGVLVMLDYEHLSHSPSATPEQKKAAGRGKLELRDDGLYLVEISWTPQATEYLKNGEYMYLSPAFKLNDEGEIVELMNVALVNMPATIDQEQLVAASRLYLSQEKTMKKLSEHLTAALSKFGGNEKLAAQLGMSDERLTALLSGGKPTDDEAKKCSVTLGVDEEELSKEFKETSYNGMDVNKTKGNEGDNTISDMHGLFQLVGQEAETTPNKPGEANENQNGSLRLSRAAVEAMIKLSADPKHREEVIDFVSGLKASADRAQKDTVTLNAIRETVAKERREQLIEKHKSKLNPALIALAREMSPKQLEVFLTALPNPNKPFEEPENKGGGNRMVTLSREEQLVFKDEKEDVIMLCKSIAADLRIVTLSNGYTGPSDRGDDKRAKTNWDRKYAEHIQHLSIFGTAPDGSPWKPAEGSTFRPRGTIVPQFG